MSGSILWSNLHLLFWLSMIPFGSAWVGENHFSQWPVTLYGIILLMAGVAYYILTLALLGHHGKNSRLATAIGRDRKGQLSLVLYLLAVALSFVNPYVAYSIYIVVALIWLLPDRRIEKLGHS